MRQSDTTDVPSTAPSGAGRRVEAGGGLAGGSGCKRALRLTAGLSAAVWDKAAPETQEHLHYRTVIDHRRDIPRRLVVIEGQRAPTGVAGRHSTDCQRRFPVSRHEIVPVFTGSNIDIAGKNASQKCLSHPPQQGNTRSKEDPVDTGS